MSFTCGFPTVIVPVLSKTIAFIECASSKLSADFINIPFSAAFPVPTIIETGVASPKAQGQDITKTEIPIEEVKVGDIIVVKPGETIAVDGVIIKGQTYIDESTITGEHIPVKKEIGSKVISGSINKNGAIEFKAEKVGEDTTISQIIKLVEEASASKAPIGRLADKVSRGVCTNCNYNCSNCYNYLDTIRISI